MEAKPTDYVLLGVYVAGGVCFVAIMLGISWWLQRRRRERPAALTPYECGELPVGPASQHFALRYYLLALLFVLFEAELLLLLPWARIMADLQQQAPDLAWVAMAEMGFFIILLLLGLLYVWRHGQLHAIGPQPRLQDTASKVPEAMYDQLNDRYAGKKDATVATSSARH